MLADKPQWFKPGDRVQWTYAHPHFGRRTDRTKTGTFYHMIRDKAGTPDRPGRALVLFDGNVYPTRLPVSELSRVN